MKWLIKEVGYHELVPWGYAPYRIDAEKSMTCYCTIIGLNLLFYFFCEMGVMFNQFASIIMTHRRRSFLSKKYGAGKSDYNFTEAIESDVDTSDIDASLVFEAIGYASTCWTKEGIFDEQKATVCAENLIKQLAINNHKACD